MVLQVLVLGVLSDFVFDVAGAIFFYSPPYLKKTTVLLPLRLFLNMLLFVCSQSTQGKTWQNLNTEERQQTPMHPKHDPILTLILVTVVIILVMTVTYLLWLEGWIDLTIMVSVVISVVVPELAIAALLYFLLGNRRRDRLDDLLSRVEASQKFGHLKVYKTNSYGKLEYYYYVENTHTKKVYRSPDFLQEAIDINLISVIGETFDNETKLEAFFKEKHLSLIDRDATITELLETH